MVEDVNGLQMLTKSKIPIVLLQRTVLHPDLSDLANLDSTRANFATDDFPIISSGEGMSNCQSTYPFCPGLSPK